MKAKHPSKPENSSSSRKLIAWAVGLGALVMVTTLYFIRQRSASSSSSLAIESPSDMIRAGQERLTGRWQRSDGGYVIEIRNALPNGKLDAVYFNPNPINVSRAEWLLKEASLVVVIELRDDNYPGSIYTLRFQETTDRLTGTYFQAVEGLTFDVEFGREK